MATEGFSATTRIEISVPSNLFRIVICTAASAALKSDGLDVYKRQEYWRAHCGDDCAYLGHVGARELRALGVLEEVLDDPMWDEMCIRDSRRAAPCDILKKPWNCIPVMIQNSTPTKTLRI